MAQSRPSTIGLITLGTKETGKPSARNSHAGFDAAGTGNRLTDRLVRHSQRKRGATDRSVLRGTAPVLDPTLGGGAGNEPRTSIPRQSFTRQVNHRDEKTILGVGQAQVWNRKSVARQPALVVAAYSALLLASLEAYGATRHEAYRLLPKWRRTSQRPSCLDLVTLLRQQWHERPQTAAALESHSSYQQMVLSAAA